MRKHMICYQLRSKVEEEDDDGDAAMFKKESRVSSLERKCIRFGSY